MSNRLRRRRSHRSERGASLVEAALITPVFLTIIFALVEGGLLFRTHLTLANAVGAGSRTVSIVATDPLSDYRTLQRLRTELAPLNENRIEKIIIFHADGPDDEPSSACRNGGGQSTPGEECNVYTPADWNRPDTQFGCVNAGLLDSFWCPDTRSASVASLDMVGVWVQAEHNYATGFFGNGMTLEDQSILSLEPTGR